MERHDARKSPPVTGEGCADLVGGRHNPLKEAANP